jgi:endonuclease/exonuclease/phosphatase family metal-dependent hydrolase
VGGSGAPAILLGDFNFGPDQAADRAAEEALGAAGFVDVAAAVGNTEPTYPGDGNRYDRVYVRGGQGVGLTPMSARVDGTPEGRALSDHLLLATEVALKPRYSSPTELHAFEH